MLLPAALVVTLLVGAWTAATQATDLRRDIQDVQKAQDASREAMEAMGDAFRDLAGGHVSMRDWKVWSRRLAELNPALTVPEPEE